MDKASASPLYITLFFLLRCVVPLLIILGLSYLLKKLGLIAEPPPTPPEYRNNNGIHNQLSNDEGNLSHGNP
jgi:hypothetical protein